MTVELQVKNPIAIADAEDFLNAIASLAFVAIALLFVAAIVYLALRFIRSTWEERQQVKWFAYGAWVFAAYVAIIISVETVRGTETPEPLNTILFMGFLSILPAGLAVSILKYRLYDIDLIINRTVVYGPLTGILMGLYIASIRLFQALFIRVVGEDSNFTILLSTLILAAIFMPIRLRLQALADRYFKETPDPTRGLRAFGDQVQSMVQLSDTAQMTRRLLDEAVAAFHAESGAVFMRQDGELRLAQTFGAWNRQAHLTVPVEHGGVQIGEVALGARYRGQAYGDDERRMLQEIAAVAARALANAQGAS